MQDILSSLVATTDIASTSPAIDCSDIIAMLDPNQTLIYSLMEIMKQSKPATSFKVEWDEDEYLPFNTQINNAAGYVAGDTTLTMDDSSMFKVNDVLRVMSTGENLLVTTAHATAPTVVRAYGTVSAAAISDNDYIFRIGNVNEEGGDVLVAKLTKEVAYYNYTQIFKHDVDISGTMEAIKMRSGGNYKARQIKKVGIDHALDMERAFLFGQLKDDSANFTKHARQMRGIYHTISTNVVTDANGIITKAEFDDFLENYGAAHGSGDRRMGKILLVGSIISAALAAWMNDKLQISLEAKKLGMSCVEYMTPGGAKYTIKHHQLFKVSPELKGAMMVIDPTQIKKRPLRPTKFFPSLPTTKDKTLGEYRTETSIEVSLEKNFALWTGTTGYSV